MPIRAFRLSLLVSVVLVPTAAPAQQARRAFALEALSPDFWRVVPHTAQLETVGTGFGFTEGPLWDATGVLYVSDETLNKIFRVYSDGRREAVIDLGDPDGNTFDAQHRLIDCASVLRAVIAVSADGHYTVIADRYDGKRFNSPNDVVVGPHGSLYFTDPTLDLPKGQPQETPFQGVYRVDASGTVHLLTKDLAQPNGLAFSPDGHRLYIDDSERRDIRVYDVDDAGALRNGRVFGTEPGEPTDGVPDGMKIDVEGHVFVTGPKGIWVWDAAGHHLGTIVLPEQPANLNWGDADNHTLYITAQTSVYKLRIGLAGLCGGWPKECVRGR